jgi:HEAT repeat protein
MDFWKKIVIYLFLIEIGTIILFLFIIPFNRLFLFYKQKKKDFVSEKISEILINCLYGKKTLSPTLAKYNKQILLAELEAFSNRIRGENWENLKNRITKSYLLPTARIDAGKPSWLKRNFAARCFSLTPLEKDEKEILQLANDPVFLVRSIAAIALMSLEKKEGILEIIKQMSLTKGYSRYFYQDLLLKGSRMVQNCIKKIAQKNKNHSIHLACLELLTNTTFYSIPKYLEDDLISDDPKMRLAAVKILANNSQESAIPHLLLRMRDSNWKVRQEAILGLQHFPSPEVLEILEQTLEDQEWLVRLYAAKTLKKMGEKGTEVLKRQINKVHQPGYDVAKFMLEEGFYNA